MPDLQNSSAAVWPQQKCVADDGAPQSWLGSWVVVSGSTALVSARNATVNGHVGQGAVYVFRKTLGIWKQVQKLTASDGGSGDQFGVCIALSGDTAVISAPNATVNGKTWQGAAYIFRLVGKTWTQKQKLVAGHGGAFDTFGIAVAMNKGTIFVGAGGSSTGGQHRPTLVYVFRQDDASLPQPAWVERQTLNAPVPNDSTSFFGSSMAATESVAFIGARGSTLGGNPGQGAVYVYTESNGSWTLSAKLVASDGAARNNFGVSIAMDGNTAVIGSPGATIDGKISQGAAYRFELQRTGWTEAQKFTSTEGTASNLFGASVNIFHKTALVGAYGVDNYRGAAYVFVKKPSGVLSQSMTLSASDGAAGDVFGYYTALDDEVAVVGAYTANIGANHQQGAVYFFNRPTFDTDPG